MQEFAKITGTRHTKYLALNWASHDVVLSYREKAALDSFSRDFKVPGERYKKKETRKILDGGEWGY